MKRSLFLFLLATFILAFLSVACVPEETGTILFISPTFGQVISIDFLDESPSIPLVVSSTYQTDKVVHFLFNHQELNDCSVKANAVDQECPPVVLTEPGEYTITAKTELLDGSINTSEVEFSWMPQETGAILFTSPSSDEVIRDGYRGMPSQSISVKITSTFRRDKLVQYTVGSQTEAIWCLVKANAVDQECPPVVLTEPGEYTITARVELLDGSFATSRVAFSWEPYTKLDIVMLGLSYTPSPVGGYLMVFGIIIGVVTFVTWIFSRNLTVIAVSSSVTLALMVISLFLLPSNGQMLFVGCWLVPFLIVMISVAIWMVRFPKPGLIVRRSDGTPVSFVSSPFSPRKRTVVVEAEDLNKEFVFKTSLDGGEDGHKNPG